MEEKQYKNYTTGRLGCVEPVEKKTVVISTTSKVNHHHTIYKEDVVSRQRKVANPTFYDKLQQPYHLVN